jgi:DNA-binding NarL/FixJ family response regulator
MMQAPFWRIWQQLLYRLGFKRGSQRLFRLDAELIQALQTAAREEKCSEDKMASKLLSSSLALRQQAVRDLACWDKLSDREKQVAALVCLRYTNRQIAGMLHLSPQTIKSHVQNVLYKFDLKRKEDLRLQLNQWDFSAWDVHWPDDSHPYG